MIPLSQKLHNDWNKKDCIGKPVKTNGLSFIDAPFGAKVCSCGGKAVQNGHCQKCWDEFQKGLRKELDDGILEKARSETNFVLRTRGTKKRETKKESDRLGELWKLFKTA